MKIETILLHGHPAALVFGDQAVIPERLTGIDRALVEAKARYALEIAAGERAGPYRDSDAERHARQAPELAGAALPRRRRRPGCP